MISPTSARPPATGGASSASALEALFAMSRHLIRSSTDSETLQRALSTFCHLAGIDRAVISSSDAPGAVPNLLAVHGALKSQQRISQGGFSQWVIENRQRLIVDEPGGDTRFLPEETLFDSSRTLFGFPLSTDSGRCHGAFLFQPPAGGEDDADAMRLGEMAATLLEACTSGAKAASLPAQAPAPQDTEPGEIPRGFEKLVGGTPKMKRLFQQVRQVAKWNTTVLVLGESGTGKELIANAIHFTSPRASGPFIKMNCAAVPDNLLESELFGYEKGAFTGATTQRAGRFEQAHRGTLFLDEIGEISASFQAKLLRVLQEGEFERLGGGTTQHVDVRVIAATNRDLGQAVREDQFRQDLYYRLNVMPLHLPPLRERLEDIDGLAIHLVSRIGEAQGRALEITPSAIRVLMRHDWPGNVRELENCLERAAVMSDEGLLDREAVVRAGLPGASVSPSVVPPTDLSDPKLDERERIVAALEQAGWVQAKAARLLNMTPRQIAYRIQMLKIDIQRF